MPPRVFSDRECQGLTSCSAGFQYETVAPTASSDRQCEVLLACNDEQYEAVAPTYNTNRHCNWMVELIVCRSICDVMFAQCGGTLPGNIEPPVTDPLEFCNLLFHKSQIRVQNSTEVASSSPCLTIDTPPETLVSANLGAAHNVRLFADVEYLDIPVAVTDVETADQLLQLTASAADSSLVQLSTRWSYADSTFILRMTPVPGTDIPNCSPTPGAGYCSTQVTVCATDTNGGQHCDSFTLEVRPVQTPPSISADDFAAVMEDEVGSVLFTVVESDIRPEEVVVTATPADESLVLASAISIKGPDESPCNTSALAGSPFCRGLVLQGRPDQNGRLSIRLDAFDGLYNANHTIMIEIIAQNDPPTIVSDFYDKVIEEDTTTMTVRIDATDDGDPVINQLAGKMDRGDLTVNISSADNPGLIPYTSPNITGSGLVFFFAIRPPQDAFGAARVIVRISDGQYIAEKYFQLTVLPVNDAPVFSAMPPVVIDEDTLALIPLALVDVDNPMGSLDISFLSSNLELFPAANMNLRLENSTWILVLQPAQHHFGTGLVSLVASDGLLSVSASINVTVHSVNDLTAIFNIQLMSNRSDGYQSGTQIYAFDIFDVETPAAEFRLANLIENGDDTISFVLPCVNPCIYAASSNLVLAPLSAIKFGGNATNRFLSVKPNEVMSGDYEVTVYVNDGVNTSSFSVNASIVAMTVDLRLTLEVDIHQFNEEAQALARDDLATAAGVTKESVLILDILPGSVILVVAITVDDLSAGKAVADEIGRLHAFGQLELAGFTVSELEIQVVGAVFEQVQWEVVNDAWGATAALGLSLIILMVVTARLFLITETTENELISTLKAEIVLESTRNGLLPRTDLEDQDQYLHCDIRHILIWLGCLYEGFQLSWVVIEVVAAAKFGPTWSTGPTGDAFHNAALDFTGPVSLYFFAGVAAIYSFIPALFLTWSFTVVAWSGYATVCTQLCSNAKVRKKRILRRLDSIVEFYWSVNASALSQLLYHRDELAAIFLDGVLLFPVLRTCFKMLTCQFDAPIDADHKDRTDINRLLNRQVFMSLGSVPKTEDEHPTCWQGVHIFWATAAFMIILGFIILTTRFTSEKKGVAGGAMRFSSRCETARVLILVLCAAVTELLSDRGWVVVMFVMATVLLLLLMNIFKQPALGFRGTNLNAFRAAIFAGLLYFASCAFVFLVLDGRTTLAAVETGSAIVAGTDMAIATAFAGGVVPIMIVVSILNRCINKRMQHNFAQHIRQALAGGVTENATPLEMVGGKTGSQTKEFVKSSIDILLVVLHHEDNHRRASAATALGEISLSKDGNAQVLNQDGIEHLTELFDDRSAGCRVASLSALGMVATTDEGLAAMATDDMIDQLCHLLRHEDEEHVFSSVASLLCTLMHCNKPAVRDHCLDAVMLMTSLDSSAARATAWDALHILGQQTDASASQDEVITMLIDIALDNDSAADQRAQAVSQLIDFVEAFAEDPSGKQLTLKDTAQILEGVLHDEAENSVRYAAELVELCSELLRVLALTHDMPVRSLVVVTVLESLSGEALQREGVERFKREIMVAAERLGGAAAFTTVFRMYDTDGSGELDLEEFKVAMRETAEIPKHKVPDEGLVELFKEIDVDGSGEVDADEFVEFIQRSYVSDPSFAALYLLAGEAELQEHIYRVIKEHIGPDQAEARREMASAALEELSGKDGSIDRILGSDQALEAFVSAFFKEDNDKVSSALAYVLVNFAAAGDEYLDRLFNAGIFEQLAPAIRGASEQKMESLIIIIGGVIKKHAARASTRIVAIFGSLIEDESWSSCKGTAMSMLLKFSEQWQQFCSDAVHMLMAFVEQTNRPAVQIPAVDAIHQMGKLDKCVGVVTEQQIIHRLLARLRAETGLEIARMINRCLCILTTAAPRGVAVEGAISAPKQTGLSRFKQLAKRVISHKDMLDYVIATVLQQLRDHIAQVRAGTKQTQCRFVGHTLQQLVATPAQDYMIGRAFLRRLTQDLRMRDMADTMLDPQRRAVASDALAIVAADAECTRPLRKVKVVVDIVSNLVPFEFGFERVACRVLARMGYEHEAICRDVVTQLLQSLRSESWAVREGAAAALGELAAASDVDRPAVRAELTPEAGSDAVSQLNQATLASAAQVCVSISVEHLPPLPFQ